MCQARCLCLPIPSPTSSRGDLPGVDRLLALSDGVVAIAIILLVLQLNVPSPRLIDPDSASELATQLGKGADQLVSYVISFFVIAQFWLVHHRVFGRITGQQEGLAWWNFAFLFTITIMPFTSDLLGKFSANPLAIDIFAVNLRLAALTTQLTVIYGRRNDLVAAETAQEKRADQLRAAASVFVIVLSIGIAWVNPSAAKYCWLLLAVAPRIADRWSGRQSA
jgi:TMEM175 potassium channel family protein